MAITIINSLYPPYIDSFMPAFDKDSSAKIYFSFSSYNSIDDIKFVHVSLTSQLTNENALAAGQVKIISVEDANNFGFDQSNGLYYVIIHKSDVINNTWLNNQYYKVQIRFDSNTEMVSVPTTSKEINLWLTSYNNYFSEWSTICLIRPIIKPVLYLRTFDTNLDEDENEKTTITLNKGIVPLSGAIQFGDGTTAETDTLQSYYIQILEEEYDNIVMTTNVNYTSKNINPNSIEYNLDLQSLDISAENKFRIRVNYTTRNLYSSYKDYNIEIAGYVEIPDFQPSIEATVDDNGIATLKIENMNSVFGTLFVRRSSNITNYKVWEDLYVNPQAGSVNLTLKDNTVGSMVWYRYSVQLMNEVGGTTEVYYSNKICPDFYDAILSRQDIQFSIKFNHKISSFKPIVNRVKIDTLGGRYPKFAENAAMNYKQFQISGMISAQEDSDELFLSKRKHLTEYGSWQAYNEQHDINEYNDYYWEREFREELVKWLNDGEPKLYRSQTEGNMAVMLTDISLTPNTTLSRRLWDFSATVYEIEDGYSLSTLDTLGIYTTTKLSSVLDPGGGEEIVYVEKEKPGQIYMTATNIFDKNDIINNYIAQLMQSEYSGILETKQPRDFTLSNVKIFFHNQPHVFARTENNSLTLITQNNIGNYSEENMILGYSFSLSGTTDMRSVFFVDSRGFYQIPDNINVTNLYLPQEDDVVTIEYVLKYKESNNVTSLIKSQTVEKTVLGQETRVFQPNEYISESIRRQYLYTTEDYYQKMDWWKGISIETVPFSIIKILYQNSDDWNTYEVGMTGILNLLVDFPINNICFVGRRLTEIPYERIKFAQEWEYGIDTNIYSSFSEIKSPVIHTVYHVNDSDYIYYIDGVMHKIQLNEDGTGIAEVPTNASVNYIGDVIRSTLH